MEKPARSGAGVLRSRWADGVLALSVLCLAAALTARFVPHTRGPARPAPVGVGRAGAPAVSDVRTVAAADGMPGTIGFDLPNEARAEGLLGARVFRDAGGMPDLSSGTDEAWAQRKGAELDLRPWLARERPSGPHHLQFWLRAGDGAGEETWTGWATFEASDLYHAGLRVTVREGERATVEVRLAGGDVVPGALVALSPASLPSSAASVLVYTGADGRCTVRGLSADHDWSARLPDGVGPSRAEVAASFRPPASRVVLTPTLTGRWTFVAHAFELPLPGASVSLEDGEGAGALPAAWPVSRWIGPGRGPRTPFVVMTPSGPERPSAPLAVLVSGFAPASLPDAREPAALVFSTASRRIEVRPAAAAAAPR